MEAIRTEPSIDVVKKTHQLNHYSHLSLSKHSNGILVVSKSELTLLPFPRAHELEVGTEGERRRRRRSEAFDYEVGGGDGGGFRFEVEKGENRIDWDPKDAPFYEAN